MLPKFGETSFAPLHYSQLAIAYVSLQKSALSARMIPPLGSEQNGKSYYPRSRDIPAMLYMLAEQETLRKSYRFSNTPAIILACNHT